MRLKWEYTAVVLTVPGELDGASSDLNELMLRLNGLGEAGWELVGLHEKNGPADRSPLILAVLKRPRNVWEAVAEGRVLRDSE
jgi:hypothetical protein